MSEYGSYNFIDKDPVIDILRSLVTLEAKVQSKSFGAICKQVSERSGVSASTLHLWFNGPTISPRFAFVQRVAHALGVEFVPDPLRGAAARRH